MANTRSDIDRYLSVNFRTTGSGKANTEIDNLDKNLDKAGQSGAASLNKIDRASVGAVTGIKNTSEAMSDALDPYDKAFSATDKLFSILGKATAVAGFVVAGFAIMSAAYNSLTSNAEATKRANDLVNASLEATSAIMGQVAQAQAELGLSASVQELIDKSKEYTDTLDTQKQAVSDLRAAQEARDTLLGQIELKERELADIRDRQDKAATFRNENLNTLAKLNREAREEIEALTIAYQELEFVYTTSAIKAEFFTGLLAAQNETSKKGREILSPYVSLLGDFAEGYTTLAKTLTEADKAATKTTKTFKALGDTQQEILEDNAQKELETYSALQERKQAADERFAKERAELLKKRSEAELAAMTEGWRERLAIGQSIADSEAEFEKNKEELVGDAIKRNIAFSNTYDDIKTNGSQAFDAISEAMAAWGVGATAIEGATMLARGLQAQADALDFGAESIAAFATGNVLAGAGLAAAAVAKQASAAAYFYGLSQLGGSGGGSGGSGGSSAPSAPSRPSRTQDSGESRETVINVYTGMALDTRDSIEDSVRQALGNASKRPDSRTRRRI